MLANRLTRPRSQNGPRHKKPGHKVYQIKITLTRSQPPIWRRIQVQSDITLAELHGILQVVMGWTNSHLHRFIMQGQIYAIPDRDDIGPKKPKDERNINLRDLLLQVGSRITYEYDFGDNWEHDLLVEKIHPKEESTHYPICLEGAGACPPEDVGGVPGYAHFLEAMGDPNHPEHQDYHDWIGGTFNPQKFDLTKINQILQNIV